MSRIELEGILISPSYQGEEPTVPIPRLAGVVGRYYNKISRSSRQVESEAARTKTSPRYLLSRISPLRVEQTLPLVHPLPAGRPFHRTHLVLPKTLIKCL